MIKLACNYLREAEELLNEGIVEFDYFKYPSLGNDNSFQSLSAFIDRLKYIKDIKPLLLHGFYPNDFNICNKRFKDNFNIETFKELCRVSETPGISFHLNGADLSASKNEVIRNSIENINFIKKYFSEMEFIAFENAMGKSNQYELDPMVISKIINKTDTDFLYDVSHAYWSSVKTGESFEEYVSKLPLNRVYEVHINGWEEKDGNIQSHMKIQDELYEHIENIISNFSVKIVTLEYGRSYDRIGSGCPIVSIDKINPHAKKEVEEQIHRLRQIINK
ncbi:DUF692 family protein [Clostridium sp. D2Q-11]|uniref:DUF692 family protein n=1 Tax=Anaeromonas frigoriresistens TaxID=2683708 RepID=A0A942UX81_9FIRM|nr:DUF692 family multinuclear iron-containing protein [Anaeromonas frigoriresistens]MBS4537282.1 DUF692 family protein [Anaeromonas frigoriresistens]